MNARIYEQAVAETMERFDLTRTMVVSIGRLPDALREDAIKAKYSDDDLQRALVGAKMELASKFLFDTIRVLEFERVAKMQGDVT